MKAFTILIAFIVSSALSLSAASLEDAAVGAERDLRESMQRYADLQERIKEEKIPLARELNALKSELREKRREAERAQRLKDNSTVDLNSLQERVEKRQEQLDYVANLVADFGQRFQRDISLPEQQLYEVEIEAFEAATNEPIADQEMSKSLRLLDQIFILNVSIDRFKDLAGGQIFPGEAVVDNGEVESGNFLLLGPTDYFSSLSSGTAGVALKAGLIPPVVG
ncbi:MAG TPA: hypothetical protein VJ960_08635, partial [Oceanipulchritudo sp.]|nr:hypothetical protein [Oceanipulchritudo sp.]